MTASTRKSVVRVGMHFCAGSGRPSRADRRTQQQILVRSLLADDCCSICCETQHGWSTSFSSSAGVVAAALSERGCVGVDIERIEPMEIDEHLCAVALNERERAHVVAAPNPVVAFLHCWCRKEAVLKALGTGLLIDPRRVDVLGSSESTDGWLAAAVAGFPRIWCRSWLATESLVMAVATDQVDALLDVRATTLSAHENGHRCLHLCPKEIS